MDNLTTSLYVSPTSGFTYEVVPTDKYGWFRYEILRDGKMVQFALTEDQISGQVKHYENPGWDGWTTSVYD